MRHLQLNYGNNMPNSKKKRLILLSNPNFAGDNNQLQGISLSVASEMEKLIISEAEFDVSILQAQDVIIIVGSHGLNFIRDIKTAQPKSLLIWVGHQWFAEFGELSIWPDVIAIPKSAYRDEIGEGIPDDTMLILTDGVAHCVNDETVMAEAMKFQPTLPSYEQFTNCVGVIIAGDAPTPAGLMKCFCPEEARSQAQFIAAHIKANGLGQERTAILILNGPRTGKHDPRNGVLISPDPHRTGLVDDSSQAFVDAFNAIFPNQVFFYDFQFGQSSAYKPVMNRVRQATQGAWYVPAESSSMVTESTYLSANEIPVFVYSPSSANETHLALVKEAENSGLIRMCDAPLVPGKQQGEVRSAGQQIAEAIACLLQIRCMKMGEIYSLLQTKSIFSKFVCDASTQTEQLESANAARDLSSRAIK